MSRVHSVFRQGMLGVLAGFLIALPATAAEPIQIIGGGISEPVASDLPEIPLAIDIAKVLRLDRPAGTVVIGNSGIADATLADNRTLVLTGKAAGTTNMIVLTEGGAEVANILLHVRTAGRPRIRVLNGLRQQTYSCAPGCEPVIAVGDAVEHFQSILTQIQARQEFSGTAGTRSP